MSRTFRISNEINPEAMYFGTLRWLSHPASTGARQITGIDVAIVPGQGHAFHKHPDQEEIIFVVSGKLEQWVEREKRILGPGDAVYIPQGVVHGSFNAGDEDLRLIVIFSPSIGESGFVSIEMANEAPWAALRAAA
jgi:quercetin dioxygenase-like cupin family protein